MVKKKKKNKLKSLNEINLPLWNENINTKRQKTFVVCCLFIRRTMNDWISFMKMNRIVVCCYNVLPIQLHKAYIGKWWSVLTVCLHYVPSVQIGSEREPWSYKHLNMRIERNVVVFFSLFLFLFFATSLFVIHYLLLSALSCCLLAKRLSMFVMCVEQSQLRFEKSEGTYVTILSSICERLVCSLCPMAKTNQNVIEVLRQMERDENKTVFLDWSTCKKKRCESDRKKKKTKIPYAIFYFINVCFKQSTDSKYLLSADRLGYL